MAQLFNQNNQKATNSERADKKTTRKQFRVKLMIPILKAHHFFSSKMGKSYIWYIFSVNHAKTYKR